MGSRICSCQNFCGDNNERKDMVYKADNHWIKKSKQHKIKSIQNFDNLSRGTSGLSTKRTNGDWPVNYIENENENGNDKNEFSIINVKYLKGPRIKNKEIITKEEEYHEVITFEDLLIQWNNHNYTNYKNEQLQKSKFNKWRTNCD